MRSSTCQRFILLLTIILSSLILSGQGFLERLEFGYGLESGRAIAASDSSYYILTKCVDDSLFNSINHHGMSISEVDVEGNQVATYPILDTVALQADQTNQMIEKNGKLISMPSISFGTPHPHIVSFDLTSKEIQVTPIKNLLGFLSFDFEFIDDNHAVAIGSFGNTLTQVMLVHFDLNGNSTLYPVDIIAGMDDFRIMKSIEITSDDTVIVGGFLRSPEYLAIPIIYEISMEGKILWQYTFDDEFLNYHLNTLFVGNDNQNITVSGKFFYDFPSENNHNVILQIDKQEGIQWTKQIGGFEHPNYGNSAIKTVLEATDKEGFIYAGHETFTTPDRFEAYIGKLSYQGTDIWKKYYSISQTWNSYNRIYDLEATPNGGYIAVGDSTYGTVSETPEGEDPYSIMILKVDKYGEIESIVNTSNSIIEKNSYLIYPNPVTQLLTIDKSPSMKVDYNITNQLGNFQASFFGNFGENSTSYSIEGLSDGLYILTGVSDSGASFSTHFFIAR